MRRFIIDSCATDVSARQESSVCSSALSGRCALNSTCDVLMLEHARCPRKSSAPGIPGSSQAKLGELDNCETA
ncbi:hypothetical protein WOLCODRAFT_139675 [Wolfiporia cocos MD-104 SS10]|uniref:Uncharacterized protein n=1 Tax=Wolfiporia cocos (strain MD-104) TaxID=742152 RepID=A0A2H3IZ28_WOLCO|nr:hypothetical protein WOLCODRAFT_139675 [Wolfiporia cocos MD-104 SS10]